MEAVVKKAKEWPDDGMVEEKWRAMRTAFVDTAVETLGKATKSQPDWFLDSEDYVHQALSPKTRNAAYSYQVASHW